MFVLCSGHISRREPAQNQIWCLGYGYSECQEKSGWSGRNLDGKRFITQYSNPDTFNVNICILFNVVIPGIFNKLLIII